MPFRVRQGSDDGPRLGIRGGERCAVEIRRAASYGFRPRGCIRGTDVKIYLQQRDPRLYYKGPGRWTKARGEAWAFKSSSEALDFCERENIRDAEIVLAFEDERYDIRFGAFRHNRVEKT